MRRREFITLLGGAAAACPLAARAQEAGRFARVGVLGPGLDNPVSGPGYQAFVSELRKLGFTEGKNVIVEYRRTDEGLPKAFTGANELVAAKADHEWPGNRAAGGHCGETRSADCHAGEQLRPVRARLRQKPRAARR
jgi:putative ABC transport system substrate-binding protein